MTKDEELDQLRTEKAALCEALRRKDEELEQSHQANQDLREGLKQAISALGSQQERVNVLEGLIDALQERIKTLERQQAKDSHNSSLPPSSDRFVRPPKSLRKKSGKKPGGQKGHRGHHLQQVANPDQILLHAVFSVRIRRRVRPSAVVFWHRADGQLLPPCYLRGVADYSWQGSRK